MSCGFHAHPGFKIVGAVDGEFGKPSNGRGTLECNSTYEANMGVRPLVKDLAVIPPSELPALFQEQLGKRPLSVLIACPPCTGFSRALPKNHLVDDPRNSLVIESALFVEALKPRIFVMENARELIRGNFSHHFENLKRSLERLGYRVHGDVHILSKFGLPQKRERSIVVAVAKGLQLRTLDDLWAGYRVKAEATHVRRALSGLETLVAGRASTTDPLHASPGFSDPSSLRRLELLPNDGGSWADLRLHPEALHVLTPAMLRNIEAGDFGSHPDVYGRLWWDRPAITIKRECSHIGNGRYSHPEQNRLCSVREMSILQGFPRDYVFRGSLSNMYRHIGDAVPPLISYQLGDCDGRSSDLLRRFGFQ